MKLAQALILRADTQKRIEQLKVRLLSNAKTQENEKPSEDPKLLLKELDKLTKELFTLICSINLTNSSAKFDGMSLTEMIAKKDALVLKANVLREFATSASQKVDLYSNSEIKILSTVDVAALQKQVDALSKEIRELEMKLQEANWAVDLVE
ncbi:DIP1984 family protein [Campylobacter concisus]|uniref:DIP1984 family protein n=1 Tax=Campylobacter concisus TaxID=199 RepID=UPI0018844330|nr:DIP1984 family protein [Campylobacter concisus]MBE9851725.1 DIP1984 family protein [Campylobacter concisus]